MELKEGLKTRRSVRRYKQVPVPEDIARGIVELARYAPSGGNTQEWELVFVDEPGMVQQVFETLAWLPSVGAPPPGQAPTAYLVVLGGKDPRATDCASLVTYITLAAHAHGVGTCWFGSVRRAELAEDLKVPADQRIAFVVALGYPDEEFEVCDQAGETRVTVEDGVTRVPKRPTDSIMHRNAYGQ